MLSMIGLLGGLVLLIVLTMRGMNLLIAAPLCALFLAVFSGIPLFPQLVEEGQANLVGGYMTGFSNFVAAWFLMFLLGSIFGKVMEDAGAADSVSKWVVEKLGMKYAVLAIVTACAILTYGGVSLFVVAFSVFPLALSYLNKLTFPVDLFPLHWLWFCDFYHDLSGFSRNSKLDSYSLLRNLSLCWMGSKPHCCCFYGCFWLLVAKENDRESSQ